ncbi:hypothetical protein [Halogeometricum limi]|uniref:Uncharacterized protein n=1 Tax=Halogeometricum limi TaxID=555875 RepID=A0A1I6G3J8_9EURY|nr:hypothetical protein [Halogeometricum limi]SFR36701.1 hypothetical protein SAMN04488124_0807 [Halogeometricum limi]
MPSTEIGRRRFLAAAGTTALATLAGCSDRLATETGGDASTLTFRVFPFDTGLRDRYVTDLNQTRVPWDEAAFAAARNDSEYTTQYVEPFPTREPVWAEFGGTYYHLDEVVVGEEEVTHPVLRLQEERRVSEDESGAPPAVDHGDLPQVDRKAVQVAYMAARARGNVGGVPWGLVQRGGYVYRDGEATEDSDLLADDAPSYVTFRDRVWAVELATETFHEAVYRPVAEPVAESDAEMEAVIRGTLVGARLDPESLSESEREILSDARTDGYVAEHPFPDAFVSLLKRLDERAYADGNVSKDGGADDYPRRTVVRYGDEYFEYRLRLDEAGEN